MSRVRSIANLVFFLFVAFCSACRDRPGTAAHVDSSACSKSSNEMWVPDSTIRICLPHGFVARGRGLFSRAPHDSASEHWIALSTDSAHLRDSDEPWPLHLASGPRCIADCSQVEGLRVLHDSIAGTRAYVEIGRISGGFSGEHRKPALVASIDLNPQIQLVVNAFSPDSALLDSLYAALATIRVRLPD